MNKKAQGKGAHPLSLILVLGSVLGFTLSPASLFPAEAPPGSTHASPSDGEHRLYRWVDPSGNIAFGDKPPESATQVAPVAVSPNIVETRTPTLPSSSTVDKSASTAPGPGGPISTGTTLDPQCETYQRQLKYLKARMRNGYPASASNRLRSQSRRLKELIAEHC